MLTKDKAICMRAVDYSETSQIVTFFTKANGKVGAIAKGSKRSKSAFDGPIEMLSYGEIVLSDPTREKLATLTEFRQQNFTHLIDDFFAFNCCLFAAELLNKLTHDNDPHPGLFDSFLNFLENINENQASNAEHRDILSLLILFQLTLLSEIGLMPVLNACANCKTQNAILNTQYEFYFSSSANGIICRDCEASFPDKIKLSKHAAACLTDLKQIIKAPDRTLREIEKILTSHFTELLGHRPKMAKHILKG
ncbi:MAG: DNA repair protein RecO [Planctomycetes bacterium RBG_13_46_10]|nr:MAG: DNA repair protein RecO [Planctomycetes bacterium RBG_13_46_10]QBM02905.1 DNA repair protein RecO [uncultured archaeon]